MEKKKFGPITMTINRDGRTFIETRFFDSPKDFLDFLKKDSYSAADFHSDLEGREGAK